MSTTHIPAELRRRVADRARYRCGYCLTPQWIIGARLQCDHIQPEADGGKTEEANLWLACSECNGHKAARLVATDPESGEVVRLFNPCLQSWWAHFRWNADGDEILGITPTGRATVDALQLNRALLVAARRNWVVVRWHPPVD